jgi:drug/metabolite transporter (DMT)-like permease
VLISSQTRNFELLLVVVTLIAAAGWVFTKCALAEFSPYIFLALRFSLAGFVLVLLSWSQLFNLNRHQLLRGLGTGVLLGGALLLWILAVDQTENIGEGAFIVSLAVVFVPIIARVFFGSKITLILVLALIPAILGLALLALQETPSGSLVFEFKESHALFLLSTLGFALHVILTGRYAQGIPYMPLTALQLMAIGFVAAVAALFTESWPSELSSMAWGWLLCSALIATSLRFALQTKALAKLDPNHAAMVFILEPVWTATLGALFLDERMTDNQLLGCVLIFCAILVYRFPLLKEFVLRKKV